MAIFGDIYQKLLIFKLNDIWRYLTIIWRYLTTETFTLKPENYRPKDIAKYRHLSPSGNRALVNYFHIVTMVPQKIQKETLPYTCGKQRKKLWWLYLFLKYKNCLFSNIFKWRKRLEKTWFVRSQKHQFTAF